LRNQCRDLNARPGALHDQRCLGDISAIVRPDGAPLSFACSIARACLIVSYSCIALPQWRWLCSLLGCQSVSGRYEALGGFSARFPRN